MSIYKPLATFVTKIEIWILIPIILASMLFEHFQLLGVGAIFISITVRCLENRRLISTPINLEIALLLVVLGINLLITPLPYLTFPQVNRLLIGIGLFYIIMIRIDTEKKIRLTLQGVSLAGIMLVIIGLASVEWSLTKLSIIPDRFFDFLPNNSLERIHPNVIAGYVALLLPIVITPLIFGKSFFDSQKINSRLLNPNFVKLLSSISVSAMFALLVLTKSRGALLGLIGSSLVMVTLRWRRGWGVSLVVFIVIAILFPQVKDFVTLLNASSNGADTFFLREEIWSRGLLIIKDYPFTGVGLGSFGPLVDSIYPLFSVNQGVVPHAHNIYIQVAVDLGIPGLIVWLSIFITIFITSWKIYISKESRNWLKAIEVGLLCSNIALAIHGLFDAVTWGMVRPAPIVWVLWGIASSGLTITNNLKLGTKNLI